MNNYSAFDAQHAKGPFIVIARSFVIVYAIAAFLTKTGVFSPKERRSLVLFLVLSPLIFLLILYLSGKPHLDAADQTEANRK